MNTEILKPIDPDLRLLRKLAYQFQQDALDGIWHDDSTDEEDEEAAYAFLYPTNRSKPK